MVQLTDEEIAIAIEYQRLFRKYVGYHCDCGSDWHRFDGPYIDDGATHKFFYENEEVKDGKYQRHYESNPVIGWFSGWHKED